MTFTPRRVLITGASGFVGRALFEALRAAPEGFQALAVPRDVDICASAELRRHMIEAKPDFVIHLAAKTIDSASWANPTEFLEVNMLGTQTLLEALSASNFNGRLLYVSTGAVYGNVPEDILPIQEETAPRPVSPYALSKLAGELLCSRWHREHGMEIVIARPFNVIGPGQRPGFVVSDLLNQITSIKHGIANQRVITVGDLDVSRDFIDVRDVALALIAILKHGSPGEVYNVCSGREMRVHDLLQLLLEHAGVPASIQIKKERLRPIQQRRAVGTSAKLQAETAWSPKITVEDSIRNILDTVGSCDE